jgi:hypothetical protein
MAHGVIIPEAIAAMNIDAYNRSVIDTGSSASPIDNGWVLTIAAGGKFTSGSLTEVWEADQPITGSLTGLWMAYSGDEVVYTNSQYKGLDPDPRNFYNVKNMVFSAFKPKVGDIILASTDTFSGSKSTGNWLVAATGSWQLAWAAAPSATAQTWRYIATKYISLATGGIDTQRVVAYEIECTSE